MAGALTFFPPEPPLYRFERHDAEGRVLRDNQEANDIRADNQSVDEEVGDLQLPESSEPLDAKTDGQTKEKMKSPIEQLTQQAGERKIRARERQKRDAKDAVHNVSFKLLLDPRLQVPPHDDSLIEAVKIPSARGVYLAAVLYRMSPPSRPADRKTIIYSHGNATDIGAMFPIQVVMAHSLDCNVLSYDYSGYGESGGVPDEHATYRDMEAVYEYVLEHLAGNAPSNVILYGQSVGSGPCCYLAATENDLGGMILHSPFTSGMRVLTPSRYVNTVLSRCFSPRNTIFHSVSIVFVCRLLSCLDIYPNIDRIKKVSCPVMVIHGRLDQEVDVSHGMDIHNAVPEECRRDPWWVSDRGHNDIIEGPGKLSQYVRRLRRFLNSLDT